MLIFLARLIALLPLSVSQGLGRVLGRLAYALPGKYRQRLRANAAQAGYTDPAFLRRAAGEVGAMILETPRTWFRNEDCMKRVTCDDGHIAVEALAEGRGVIFLTPHLGSFEIAAGYGRLQYASPEKPGVVMYRIPRKAILASLLRVVRNAPNLRAVPATLQGVREFVRALKRGGIVGMLPDQAPSEGEGVWAPFFGRMAYTVTLPGKLCVQTNAPVIVTAGERLPNGRGWRIHNLRVPEPLPDAPAEQAALINAAMETLIRRFPEQYLWGYNRYKTPRGAPPAPDADQYLR